jgi:predicted RNase H-like nuclease (RuvC/YqgF family)
LLKEIKDSDIDALKKSLKRLSSEKSDLKDFSKKLDSQKSEFSAQISDLTTIYQNLHTDHLTNTHQWASTNASVETVNQHFGENCKKIEKLNREMQQLGYIDNLGQYREGSVKDEDFFYLENLLKESKFQRGQGQTIVGKINNEISDLKKGIESIQAIDLGQFFADGVKGGPHRG